MECGLSIAFMEKISKHLIECSIMDFFENRDIHLSHFHPTRNEGLKREKLQFTERVLMAKVRVEEIESFIL